MAVASAGWPRSCAGAALALSALAGCSGSPGPQPATLPPAGRAATTPAASTAPAASTPAASPTPTTAAAQIEATMRAYFVAVNRMIGTGDVTQVRSLSMSRCPCRAITDQVARIYSAGGRYEAGPINVLRVRVHDVQDKSGVADVVARVTPYQIIAKSGRVLEDSSGGRVHTDYSLVQQGDRWIIGNAFNLDR